MSARYGLRFAALGVLAALVGFPVALVFRRAFEEGLLRAEGEQGTCRVICFSPRHDLTLAQMPPADVRRVVGP